MLRFIVSVIRNVITYQQNQPTGDCYVQMQSVDAAAKVARRLHKQHMGHRYIEIFEVRNSYPLFLLTIFKVLFLSVYR